MTVTYSYDLRTRTIEHTVLFGRASSDILFCYYFIQDVPASAGAGVPAPSSAPMSAGPTAGSLAPTFFYQPPPPPPPPSSAPIPSSPVASGRMGGGANSSQRHLLTSDYFGSGGSNKRNLNSDTISLFDVACTLASSPSFRKGAGETFMVTSSFFAKGKTISTS